MTEKQVGNTMDDQPEFLELLGAGTAGKTDGNGEKQGRLFIEKMKSGLLKKGFQKVETDEIIQDTLAAAIQARERFKGRNGAAFKTYVYAIMKNKTIDFIRKKDREAKRTADSNENSEPLFETEDDKLSYLHFKHKPDDTTARLVKKIIERLKEHLATDPTGCARLFLDIWHAFKQGGGIKDVAGEYGVKPNTLTQRKQRCQEPIQKMLEDQYAISG